MSSDVANYLNQQIAGRYRTSINPPKQGSLLDAALSQQTLGNSTGDSQTGVSDTDAAAEVPSANGPAQTAKRKLKSTSSGTLQDSPKSNGLPNKRPKNAAGTSKSTGPSTSTKYLPPTARLDDLGGCAECIEQILELVAMPVCHPEIYLHTGVRPPRGVLLHGPPGCGKTMLANAIAGELGCPFISISAPSIVSGMSGESERALRETFEEAIKVAPCILFIDEIDAITGKRENAQREMERRIVAQLLTCMDDLSWEKTDNKPVMVIGATNRPDSLDAALRRAGRFDHEIAMGVPNERAREQILRVISSKLRLSGDFDFRSLAKLTPGYVGADLSALTAAAGIIAVKRIFQQIPVASDPLFEVLAPGIATPVAQVESMALDDVDAELPALGSRTDVRPNMFRTLPLDLSSLAIATFLRQHSNALSDQELAPLAITNDDFLQALEQIQPSSKREGFTTVPDVTWADVGALHGIRDEIRMAIVQPIRRPDIFEALGIANPCGVLLWGPPGCGKTLLAKAVANESMANFISVKGPELLNKYVGESERAVRQVFSRARASSPCIIFFDELDALVPRRDDSLSESSARVVNTLLTELDGLHARKQVYVIAATNRPDMIDPAMVRPGRLDKMLFVDLPSRAERADILRTQSVKTPFSGDVDFGQIAADTRCDGFSGADLSALIREAAVFALRDNLSLLDSTQPLPLQVNPGHIHAALDKIQPSVSAAQRKRYEVLRSRYSGTPIGQKEKEIAPQSMQ